MSAPFGISVLDQSPIADGATGADALRNTLDLAQLADALGYRRYWVAEHHGGGLVAGPSPEVLIGPIASVTSEIRVGSGGVMLPHYSPFKVAENFSLLAGLYPDRIDMAIGRAPGTDQLTAFALQRDRRHAAVDDFPAQLGELLAYLEDRMPADHPFAHLAQALPGRPQAPEPWLLGSSPQSALWAGELGLPYAFADFINPAGVPIAGSYRERFVAGRRLERPHVAVAVWALCADSREEAEHLAASHRWAFIKLRRGELIPVPTPEEAERQLAAQGVPLRDGHRRRTVLGTGDQVRAELEQVVAEYGADELIVVTITHDHGARRRSYELLAAAFELEPRAAGALTGDA